MGQSLQKFSCSYSAQEDRLMLTIGMDGDTAQRLWLTRRFVRGLWQGLMKFLGEMASMPEESPPEVKKAVMAIRHQETVTAKAKSMSRTKSPPKEETPEAALALSASIAPPEDGVLRLSLKTAENVISLKLDEETLHGFCHLLRQGTDEAGWGLGLKVGDGNVAAPGAQVH